MGSGRPQVDFERLVNLWRIRQLRLDELITRRLAFSEINSAFDDHRRGVGIRGVLDIRG